MFGPVFRIWLLLLLGGCALPGVYCIEINTPAEVEAVNGTDVKLKCTFITTAPVSEQSVTVSWNFRPLVPGPDESVFYFDKEPFPPDQGRFKGKAVWSGDISRKDASITLRDVHPTFNGTYVCQVRNRPDVHGSNGETTLKVVEKVSISEISILAIAIGAGILLVLVILGVMLAFKLCRRPHGDTGIEMHPSENKSKDSVL